MTSTDAAYPPPPCGYPLQRKPWPALVAFKPRGIRGFPYLPSSTQNYVLMSFAVAFDPHGNDHCTIRITLATYEPSRALAVDPSASQEVGTLDTPITDLALGVAIRSAVSVVSASVSNRER